MMSLPKSNTAVGKLRILGLFEGISFLLLIFIGMPLKYMAGILMPLKIMGWAHGLLFILFVLALFNVMLIKRWSILKVLASLLSSLLPFGTFYMDKFWKKDQ